MNRLDDLATPFRELWLYHPEQRREYSIDSVLQAWIDHYDFSLSPTLAEMQLFEYELTSDTGFKDHDGLFEDCRIVVESMGLLLRRLISLATDETIESSILCPDDIDLEQP